MNNAHSNDRIFKSIIYCPDIECDSCTKLIGRKLDHLDGVKSYRFGADRVIIDHTDEVIDKTFIDSIKSAGFDPDRRKILKTVKENDAITQSTLRFKTGMSKAHLSMLINDLERNGFISRKPKGRTYEVYIRMP